MQAVANQIYSYDKAFAVMLAVQDFFQGTDVRRLIQAAALQKQEPASPAQTYTAWNDRTQRLDGANQQFLWSQEMLAWLTAQAQNPGASQWKNPPYHLQPQAGVNTNFQKALLQITEQKPDERPPHWVKLITLYERFMTGPYTTNQPTTHGDYAEVVSITRKVKTNPIPAGFTQETYKRAELGEFLALFWVLHLDPQQAAKLIRKYA